VNPDVSLTNEERELSSGLRELLVVEKTLEKWLIEGSSYNNIYWSMDSANVVSFLSKGSSRPHVQAKVFKMAEMLSKPKLLLTPVYFLRSDTRIKVADELSKRKDSDDWPIDQESFWPCIDCMNSIWMLSCQRQTVGA